MSRERNTQNYPINYHWHLKRNEIKCTAVSHTLEPNPYCVVKIVSVFFPVAVDRKTTGFWFCKYGHFPSILSGSSEGQLFPSGWGAKCNHMASVAGPSPALSLLHCPWTLKAWRCWPGSAKRPDHQAELRWHWLMGESWRLALLWHHWDRDWCPQAADMGSWAGWRKPQGAGQGSVSVFGAWQIIWEQSPLPLFCYLVMGHSYPNS